MNTEPEYFGYIKVTRTGLYRGIIASVHETGEPDGDRLLQTQFESPFFHDLEEAREQLKEQCEANNIRYTTETYKATMMGAWESEFSESEIVE